MNIKRNIIFTLESRKKDGVLIVENMPIRMRVNFASKRIEFTTGYRIDAAKWDSDKQRVKNGCSNKLKELASEINEKMNDYLKELAELEGINEPIRQTYYRGNSALTKIHQNMPCLARTPVVERLSAMRLHWEYLRR